MNDIYVRVDRGDAVRAGDMIWGYIVCPLTSEDLAAWPDDVRDCLARWLTSERIFNIPRDVLRFAVRSPGGAPELRAALDQILVNEREERERQAASELAQQQRQEEEYQALLERTRSCPVRDLVTHRLSGWTRMETPFGRPERYGDVVLKAGRAGEAEDEARRLNALDEARATAAEEAATALAAARTAWLSEHHPEYTARWEEGYIGEDEYRRLLRTHLFRGMAEHKRFQRIKDDEVLAAEGLDGGECTYYSDDAETLTSEQHQRLMAIRSCAPEGSTVTALCHEGRPLDYDDHSAGILRRYSAHVTIEHLGHTLSLEYALDPEDG